MEDFSVSLIAFGAVLLFGVIAYALSSRIAIPQVSILILIGVAIGPSGLDVLPPESASWYPKVSTIALLFVGFLLGGRLSIAKLREHGSEILSISILHVFGVAIFVALGLIAAGVQVEIALMLAGIGTSTAPAAIQSVVLEMGAKGGFTDTLLGVVAIDDAWGLILFSLLLILVGALGEQAANNHILIAGLWDIGGAILIGVLLGVPSAMIIRHLRPGQPMQVEAIGIVLVCGGIALSLDVSFLLCVMVLGAVVANLIKDGHDPFAAIENVEWPFLVLFFVLSGASLKVDNLMVIGWIGAVYIVLRSIGKFGGAWLGGWLVGMDPKKRWWIGMAAQPQAGVALGMALIAGNTFPEYRDTILTIIIGSTVVYEIGGPVLTRLALIKVGEADQNGGV